LFITSLGAWTNWCGAVESQRQRSRLRGDDGHAHAVATAMVLWICNTTKTRMSAVRLLGPRCLLAVDALLGAGDAANKSITQVRYRRRPVVRRQGKGARSGYFLAGILRQPGGRNGHRGRVGLGVILQAAQRKNARRIIERRSGRHA